jgi:hypothetical protein
MATVTKAVLKTYFEQGDIPTQGQYVDLIDSQFGLGETGTIQIIQGTISASAAEIEFMKFKKLNLPGAGVADMKVGTTFIIGRTLEVSGSLRVYDVDNEASLEVVGSITASGNMESAKYHSIGRNLLRYKPNWSASIIGNQHEDTLITGSSIQLGGRLVNGTSTVTNCHVTASANISASGTITGLNIVAKGNTTFGDGLADTHTFTGNITASNASFLSGSFSSITSSKATITNAFVTSVATISGGISLSHNNYDTVSYSWENGGLIEHSKRMWIVRFSDFPTVGYKDGYSNETMVLTHPLITVNSIILVQQAAILNSAGTYIGIHVSNVHEGRAILTPYFYGGSTGQGGVAQAGGSADYNFVLL